MRSRDHSIFPGFVVVRLLEGEVIRLSSARRNRSGALLCCLRPLEGYAFARPFGRGLATLLLDVLLILVALARPLPSLPPSSSHSADPNSVSELAATSPPARGPDPAESQDRAGGHPQIRILWQHFFVKPGDVFRARLQLEGIPKLPPDSSLELAVSFSQPIQTLNTWRRVVANPDAAGTRDQIKFAISIPSEPAATQSQSLQDAPREALAAAARSEVDYFQGLHSLEEGVSGASSRRMSLKATASEASTTSPRQISLTTEVAVAIDAAPTEEVPAIRLPQQATYLVTFRLSALRPQPLAGSPSSADSSSDIPPDGRTLAVNQTVLAFGRPMSGSHPLKVALVVPIASTTPIQPSAPETSAASGTDTVVPPQRPQGQGEVTVDASQQNSDIDRHIAPADRSRIERIVGALNRWPNVPITLAIQPSTLSDLVAARTLGDDTSARILMGLGVQKGLSGNTPSASPIREYIASPFAWLPRAYYEAPQLSGVLDRQIQEGLDVLKSNFGESVLTEVALPPPDGYSTSALRTLVGRGIEAALVRSSEVKAARGVPFAQPVLLVSGESAALASYVAADEISPSIASLSTSTAWADPSTSTGNAGTSPPGPTSGPTAAARDGDRTEALAAETGYPSTGGPYAATMAPLAVSLSYLHVLWLELQGAPRGVLLLPPPRWDPDPVGLDLLLEALATSEWLEPVTVETLFDTVPLAGRTRRSADVVDARDPAADNPARQELLGSFLRAGEAVEGVSSVFGPRSEVYLELFEIFDRAPSAWLASIPPKEPGFSGSGRDAAGIDGSQTLDREVAGAYESVRAEVLERLSALTLPPTTGITLAAQSSVIPVRIENQLAEPARVSLKFESDKLVFPSGNPISDIVVPVGGSTLNIPVEAQSTGTFTVLATLSSPDGRLVIATGSIPVRYMRLGPLSVALATGAVVVLVFWWISQVRRKTASGSRIPARRIPDRQAQSPEIS